jgi:hypothetical protein
LYRFLLPVHAKAGTPESGKGSALGSRVPWTPTVLDPNPHATLCNSEQYRELKTLCICGNCTPVQRPATTDRTLVMSRGKRFESARRLSQIGLYKPNTL